MSKKVVNEYGKVIDFDAAVMFMDDELREYLHMELAPCSDQEFFDAYGKAYEDKFGIPFVLCESNPVW